MSKDKPAFPVTGFETRHGQGMQAVYHSGLSLRDYFAAQALTGSQIWDAVLNEKNAIFAQEHGAEKLAQVAYAIADAMLRAREET